MSSLIHQCARFVQRPRLLSASVIGLTAFAFTQLWMPVTRSLLIAFNFGVIAYLTLMVFMFSKATTSTMRKRAEVQEEGKWTVLGASLFVALAVLGALSSDLHAAKVKSGADIVLASSTIFFSWAFVAFTFSQHYAHAFYTKPDQLEFPNTPLPDYWDFLYFSTVLSMCCQTSDVVVKASDIRRIVLLQSVLSFFFNVIIISITVNVVAGVL
jgi:uncharacterized membrane protein